MHWHWAIYMGVLVFGSKWRLCTPHVGVGSYMVALDCTHRCSVVHDGVKHEMQVSGPLASVVFEKWVLVVHAGVWYWIICADVGP